MKVESLRQRVRGEVLSPGDAAFQERSKIFNVRAQRVPAGVVRCLDTADVVAAVRFAAEEGLPLTVRSGGHALGGQSVGEGALVLDLRSLDSVELGDGVVTVGGGIRGGALNALLWKKGLCLSTGFEPRVGLSGLLLGGGYGLLARRHGLTCDQLLEAEVVLADGSVVVTDAQREPDLFWALRGAGAHFGVVTRMKLRTVLLPVLTVATASFSIERAADVFRAYEELAPTVSTDTSLYMGLNTDEHGVASVQLMGFHLGDEASGKKALTPATRLAHPLWKSVSVEDFEAVHPEGLQFPENFEHAWRAHFFDDTHTACDAMVQFAARLGSLPFWVVLEHLGGAIGDVAPSDSAFVHRSAKHGFVTSLRWQGAPPHEALALQEAVHAELQPRSLGTYANYVTPTHGPSAIEAAYGANLPKLRALKERFDPHRRLGLPLR